MRGGTNDDVQELSCKIVAERAGVEHGRPNRRRGLAKYAIASLLTLLAGHSPGKSPSLVLPSTVDEYLKTLKPVAGFLSGDKWGWDLSDFPNFFGFYFIHGTQYVIAAKDTDHVLLLDMDHGKAMSMNVSQEIDFDKVAGDSKLAFNGYTLSSNNVNMADGSHGGTFSCTPAFGTYYTFSNKNGLHRSVYLIVRYSHPVTTTYQTCFEGSTRRGQSYTLSLDGAFAEVSIAPDGTPLLFTNNTGFVLHLDQHFLQHTTLGGRIFLVDAQTANAKLDASQAYDPIVRAKVFESLIPPATNQR